MVGVADGGVLGFEEILVRVFGIELGEAEWAMIESFYIRHNWWWNRRESINFTNPNAKDIIVAGCYACKEELPREHSLRIALSQTESHGEAYLRILEQIESIKMTE